MEQDKDVKSGKRYLLKANATRDQVRMVVQSHLEMFKRLSRATDDEIAEFAVSDPDTCRFMALALIHEVSITGLQNSVDEVEIANG